MADSMEGTGASTLPDKDQNAKELAEAHYEIEPGMEQIFRIFDEAADEDTVDEPMKLLEVNRNTIAAGIIPLYFGPIPKRGIHYPSIIVEITPEEFESLGTEGDLQLPAGWTIGGLIPKPIAISR